MRFSTDPAAPLVDVTWYFVDDSPPIPAVPLPFYTVFGSGNWAINKAQPEYDGLGEAYTDPGLRRWSNGHRPEPFPRVGYPCGTADQWENGVAYPWPVDPNCCQPFVNAAIPFGLGFQAGTNQAHGVAGTFSYGESWFASVASHRTVSPLLPLEENELAVVNSARHVSGLLPLAEGVIADSLSGRNVSPLLGTAEGVISREVSHRGSLPSLHMETAFVPAVNQGHAAPSTYGQETDLLAYITSFRNYSPVPTTPLETDFAAAVHSFRQVPIPPALLSQPFATGFVPVVVSFRNFPPTGSDSATLGFDMDFSALVTSGSLPPTPGADCDHAADISLGTEYTFAISSGAQHWFKFSGTSGTTYKGTFTAVSGSIGSWNMLHGLCSGLNAYISGAGYGCSDHTATATDTIFIQVTASIMGGATYKMKIDTGAC